MLQESATAAEIVRAAERHGWRPGCSVLTVAYGLPLPVIRTATDPAAARCERRGSGLYGEVTRLVAAHGVFVPKAR
jgi:hypothetical protein